MKIKTQVAFVGGVGVYVFFASNLGTFFLQNSHFETFPKQNGKKNVYLNVVHTDFVKCLMLVVHEISL